ncbi:hypothetical protein HYFRA_00009031 [Hymenoscyphus fraxineus]|uniref:UBC core domain-containing protein n=1 Tax=Hymenoscyphus fraxineus TaxID=746836 RepID=A0A9N9KTF1_9HELO|nr:hypothetical protein HYFRA_00009031 [Hymenoscyphus fraxineus]
MATPKFNSKSPTIKRILKEAQELAQAPSPDYHASPASEDNIFEWHFTLRGPPSSAYEKGIYHGRIILPPTYPLRPPSFRFLTPSGRFEVNREICLSISGHHEETWQPAWGIRTALVALRSFMETDAKGQLGGLEVPEKERRGISEGTGAWKCGGCGRTNGEILRECEEAARELEEKGQKKGEVEVPKELKMGFKDEMGKKEEGKGSKDVETDAELAEGFVQTTTETPSSTTPPLNSNTNPNGNTVTTPYPPARPAQTVPQPTGTASSSNPQRTTPAPASQNLAQRGRNSDGVPLWIDRAIAGVFILLVAMVTKIMLGL